MLTINESFPRTQSPLENWSTPPTIFEISAGGKIRIMAEILLITLTEFNPFTHFHQNYDFKVSMNSELDLAHASLIVLTFKDEP